MYGGDLLAGFDVRESLFEEWLLAERERLRDLTLEVIAKLLAHYLKTDQLESGTRVATRLLALDPLQEAVHRTLMRLYVRQDRRAEALRQYQLCASVLRRELGAEPEHETRQLYQEVYETRRTPRAFPVSGSYSMPRSQGPSRTSTRTTWGLTSRRSACTILQERFGPRHSTISLGRELIARRVGVLPSGMLLPAVPRTANVLWLLPWPCCQPIPRS